MARKNGISKRFFKIGNVLEETLRIIGSFKDKRDLELDEPNQYEVFVYEISPGSTGIHQIEEVRDFFHISPEGDFEDRWDEVDEFTGFVSEDLTEQLRPFLPDKYKNGSYQFHSTEGGGDYGLFFGWEEPPESGKEV